MYDEKKTERMKRDMYHTNKFYSYCIGSNVMCSSFASENVHVCSCVLFPFVDVISFYTLA